MKHTVAHKTKQTSKTCQVKKIIHNCLVPNVPLSSHNEMPDQDIAGLLRRILYGDAPQVKLDQMTSPRTGTSTQRRNGWPPNERRSCLSSPSVSSQDSGVKLQEGLLNVAKTGKGFKLSTFHQTWPNTRNPYNGLHVFDPYCKGCTLRTKAKVPL